MWLIVTHSAPPTPPPTPLNLGSVSLMLHKKHSRPAPDQERERETQKENKRRGGNPHISCFWTIKFFQYGTFKQKIETFTHTEVWSYNIPIGYFVIFVCVYHILILCTIADSVGEMFAFQTLRCATDSQNTRAGDFSRGGNAQPQLPHTRTLSEQNCSVSRRCRLRSGYLHRSVSSS